jgi:carbon monoxide dehydrogenase subunit G
MRLLASLVGTAMVVVGAKAGYGKQAYTKGWLVELNGEVMIAAARPRVWAALNDPEVLARCIEGVETLTRVAGEAGERFEGKMNAKVGPIRASFTGQVTLTEVMAPESYVLVGEGKGGVAGFAKGNAAVSLAEIGPNETRLTYAVKSSVGGKLAQLGARLIEGTAKGYAESFFARLKAELETAASEVETPPDFAAIAAAAAGGGSMAAGNIDVDPIVSKLTPSPPSASASAGISPILWGGGLILLVLAFLAWQWR